MAKCNQLTPLPCKGLICRTLPYRSVLQVLALNYRPHSQIAQNVSECVSDLVGRALLDPFPATTVRTLCRSCAVRSENLHTQMRLTTFSCLYGQPPPVPGRILASCLWRRMGVEFTARQFNPLTGSNIRWLH